MKKVMLCGLAFAGLMLSPAIAADIPARAPAVYRAPVAVVPSYSWTGCHLGIQGGYAWGKANYQNVEVDTNYSRPHTQGWLGGGNVGCDYQNGALVFGVSGEFNASDIHGSEAVSTLPLETVDVKTKWFGSADGRIGWALDRVLVYAVGGVAFADIAHTYFAAGGTVPAPFGSTSFTGWTAGGGIDWAITPNWVARIEYRHYDFGDKTYAATVVSGVTVVAHTVDFSFSLLKAGLSYKF